MQAKQAGGALNLLSCIQHSHERMRGEDAAEHGLCRLPLLAAAPCASIGSRSVVMATSHSLPSLFLAHSLERANTSAWLCCAIGRFTQAGVCSAG